jgi:8-oxo-dGTP pyrophosphatase MutT (NUDIX family)
LAYITNGNGLLVCRQPDFPEAGVQAPGGSMHPGERLEDAVLREAFEETGLSGLALGAFPGDAMQDYSPLGRLEIHHEHCFHLPVEGDVPETWQHRERDPSGGDVESVLFDFFWVELPDGAPPRIVIRDEKIPELLAEPGHS